MRARVTVSSKTRHRNLQAVMKVPWSLFRQKNYFRRKLFMNWRPEATQYFSLSCASVSLTPLWTIPASEWLEHPTTWQNARFLISIRNLFLSWRSAFSRRPRQLSTAISSRYNRSRQTSKDGGRGQVSTSDPERYSHCNSQLWSPLSRESWHWYFLNYQGASLTILLGPTGSPWKQRTRDVTAKSLFKEL